MTGSSGSIFSPVSPHAQAITDLFVISLWICAVIFAIVAGLVGYSLFRYRWREGTPEPEQTAGHKKLEIVWTVIPFLIVLLLFGLTVRAMQHSDPPPSGNPDLIVVGHQWWWEVRDPKNGFVTANEIHIPVGRPISIELDATDVLHEFWVPQLTRKMTTVPGARNHVWMQADKPGVYEGVCSEFCGTQHAWMRFQVVAESPEDYAAWVRHQQSAARPPAGAAARGQRLFRDMTCVNCHTVRDSDRAPNAGPDLTHLATRRQIGSGILPNTPENLRRWLSDPQQVKPGVKMPNFKLTDEQLDDLLAYLHSLE
ncbi:cytochrome c oxidase subunit II [Opitutus sp. ER46]|uniref:cytochrome c oxidase subunit II n=1 Tax=Opitutus sp. ER46 TaxID=2161864 RepID=UPI000D30CECC|nr:cytochrome c oxidase subunit II [Opitutus sp. ER46]PTX91037.1 cytochrome c oxidase subunit II [Opitutus sp. ER46]